MANALSRYWRLYRSLPVMQRELVTFGLALAFALTLLPLAIWIAGQAFLGDYLREALDPNLDASVARHGGPFALFADYLRGIFAGSPGHWLVLLGPYVLLCAYRVGRRFV